jgi:hypothetical protein
MKSLTLFKEIIAVYNEQHIYKTYKNKTALQTVNGIYNYHQALNDVLVKHLHCLLPVHRNSVIDCLVVYWNVWTVYFKLLVYFGH